MMLSHFLVILVRIVVVPIEARKGDAAKFFRDPRYIWKNG